MRLVASIQFEDNGPGVLSEIRDTIFYPLVSGRADGTGLGLGIAQVGARRLVDAPQDFHGHGILGFFEKVPD